MIGDVIGDVIAQPRRRGLLRGGMPREASPGYCSHAGVAILGSHRPASSAGLLQALGAWTHQGRSVGRSGGTALFLGMPTATAETDHRLHPHSPPSPSHPRNQVSRIPGDTPTDRAMHLARPRHVKDAAGACAGARARARVGARAGVCERIPHAGSGWKGSHGEHSSGGPRLSLLSPQPSLSVRCPRVALPPGRVPGASGLPRWCLLATTPPGREGPPVGPYRLPALACAVARRCWGLPRMAAAGVARGRRHLTPRSSSRPRRRPTRAARGLRRPAHRPRRR